MDNKVDITHKEWTDTQSKLSTIERDIESIKTELNKQEKDISTLNNQYISFRLALSDSIKEEVKPIVNQIASLSEENRELNEQIIKIENEKNKIVASVVNKILLAVATSVSIYFITLMLNNIFS